MKFILLIISLLPITLCAQKKLISLEDIYKSGTFKSEPIKSPFLNSKEEIKIKINDENGKDLPTDDLITSPNGQYQIISKDREHIYRHSSKAITYLHQAQSNVVIKLSDDKLMNVTFSPDGNKIAFVKNNNLFLYDIASQKETAITNDGKWNFIINGNADWVYEEEFSFTQAYQWSNKGNFIAYYRFDESNVKEYTFTNFNDEYNKQYTYKYPKAGEANSIIEIHIYNVNTGNNIKADFEQGDIYIPKIRWTQDDNQLMVFWMNRHQDDLKLLKTNALTGKSNLFFEEKNKRYVDIDYTDNWWFLADGINYVYTSEISGYNQIYFYNVSTKKSTLLTPAKFDVAEVNSVDEKNKIIYYSVAYPRPMDRNIYAVSFDGKQNSALTSGQYWHRAEFNADYSQMVDYVSDINTPQSATVYHLISNKKNMLIPVVEKQLGNNEKLRNKLANYNIGKVEFLRIPNSKGDTLNGWMLKPVGFDENKKYPILFCNYGGPGSQQVANRFGAASMWHQLLAQQGFIVVCVDNTGTGFRGEEFKKKTYLQLGKFEIEDQIDAAKYLSKLNFVDKNNIGHWGWSFGGFMSSLAITKGADVFTGAVAVAPVTSWRYYDNIYTERFMRTPQENAQGYDDNSPINFTNKIKGKYLLIHGTADDNVHFQNSVEMVKALVKSNIDFESAYYPDKNHGISGNADNTTFHLWSKMTNWIINNLGNENTLKLKKEPADKKGF